MILMWILLQGYYSLTHRKNIEKEKFSICGRLCCADIAKSNPVSILPSLSKAAACCCFLLDFFWAMTEAASRARSDAVVSGQPCSSALDDKYELFDEATEIFIPMMLISV